MNINILFSNCEIAEILTTFLRDSLNITYLKAKEILLNIETDSKIEYSFKYENILHYSKNNELLLENRLFDKDDNMINSILLICDKNTFKIKTEYIDDVWSYTNWEYIDSLFI